MKYKEITTKTEAELKSLLTELKVKLHDTSVKLRLGQLKNPKELSVLKKDIAKILTHLHIKKV